MKPKKIKEIKKFVKLENGMIRKSESLIFMPEAQNEIVARVCAAESGAFFAMSIPVVDTADTIEELENEN